MAPFLYLQQAVLTARYSIRLCLLCVAALLSACSEQQSEYQHLSAKPPMSVIPHTQTVKESIIQTRLSIQFDSLLEKLEADLPELLYDDEGEIKQKCVRIFGANICETYQVGGWARRTGPIQLLPLNNGFLRLAIPVEYKLKVKGKGKIVKELLRNIDFRRAAFTAIADLQPSINSHWQLAVAAQSSIQWNQHPTVNVLGIEIDIQNKVEKPLLAALDKALQKQQVKIAADNRLRERVESFWKQLQTPRKLSSSYPLWLHVTPQALSVSGLRMTHKAIETDLSLRARFASSQLAERQYDPILPLPPADGQLLAQPTVSLNLPLALTYASLADTLQQRLTRQPLAFKQGKTSIRIKSVEIYPSDDRLVLAAKVELSGLANLLKSDGEIYISGKPVIDNQSKQLRLDDVAFSRKLDSIFWTTATQLLHTKLLAGLQDALVYDFSSRHRELFDSINEQINSHQNDKFKLNGALQALDIRNIELDLDELRLIVEAQGKVTVEMTTL